MAVNLAIFAACTQTPCPNRVNHDLVQAEIKAASEGAIDMSSPSFSVEKTVEVLERYEKSGDPLILGSLAFFYGLGRVEFPSDDALDERISSLVRAAALCGDDFAIMTFAGFRRYGQYSLEANPELADCLGEARGLEEYWAARHVRWCLKQWEKE